MKKKTKGILGSLSKFTKPRILQAMIWTSIWLATKTCQLLAFGLSNLWQFFYPTFGC
jgi:hypothetical protein